MSILNVNTIQPIGSGTTVTVAATELKTSNFITVGTGASVTSPSANVLTLGTNSAERLRITSAGLIGIGTVSPSGPIHAHVASGTQRSYLEASAAHSFLRLKSGSTSYNSGLEFFSGASNIANVNGLGAGGLQFEVNGSERLRITSAGKVGINTNAATARLDISHPNTEQGLVVRSRYGNIATAMVKFDGDPNSNGGDGNVLHLHGGSSRTDSEILHIDSTGAGDIFDIRGDGLTRVYKQLQLEHSSNVAKIIFNEYGANDIKAQIEMDQVNGSAGQLIFRTQDSGTLSERLRITSDGHVLPGANNTYDLGSTAKGWRNVYMNDLNLSNMNGDTNDVDGTQGSWTIQEGKDDLYIINRLNGKKFKIKMEEIS